MDPDFVRFEDSLYGDFVEDIIFELKDLDFWVDRIIKLPRFRPLCIDKAVNLCVDYCKNNGFRQQLLEKALECPVLIYRLFKKGILAIDEVFRYTMNRSSLVYCYYFREHIEGFESFISNKMELFDDEYDKSYLDANIEALIEYGFVPSSIEYCLKYDDFEVFREILGSEPRDIMWSPFEWSARPKSFAILNFSAFFGSINCFKHLLLNGYEINNKIKYFAICSGSMDIFRLCGEGEFNLSKCLFKAVECCRLSFLAFLVDNGAKINTKEYNRIF